MARIVKCPVELAVLPDIACEDAVCHYHTGNVLSVGCYSVCHTTLKSTGRQLKGMPRAILIVAWHLEVSSIGIIGIVGVHTDNDTIVGDSESLRCGSSAEHLYLIALKVPAEAIVDIRIVIEATACPLAIGRDVQDLEISR